MTSSSPKKSDAEALESSRLGCRDNIINFESIQKITVSGKCPPPRPVSKPIEIQNNIVIYIESCFEILKGIN